MGVFFFGPFGWGWFGEFVTFSWREGRGGEIGEGMGRDGQDGQGLVVVVPMMMIMMMIMVHGWEEMWRFGLYFV